MNWAGRVGALLWVLQPLYLVAELVVAARARGYSLVGDTISDLGATSCRGGWPMPACSPWHETMNTSFVGWGLILAIGALLLHAYLPARPGSTISTLLWVVAGLGSVATGLLPVNESPGLHYAVAAPLFVAQPVALLVLGRAVRGRSPTLASYALLTGAGCALATALFLALPAAAGLDGLLERLALWPVKVTVAVLAVGLWRTGALRHQPPVGAPHSGHS